MSAENGTVRMYLPDKAILSVDFSPYEIIFTSTDLFRTALGASSLDVEFYLVLQDNGDTEGGVDKIHDIIELDRILGSPIFGYQFIHKKSLSRPTVVGNKLTFAWIFHKDIIFDPVIEVDREAFLRIRFTSEASEFLRDNKFEIMTGNSGSQLQMTFNYPRREISSRRSVGSRRSVDMRRSVDARQSIDAGHSFRGIERPKSLQCAIS